MADLACVVDANALVWLRGQNHAVGLDPAQVVGSGDLVITDTILAELFFRLDPGDYWFERNLEFLSLFQGVVEHTDADVATAEAYLERFARHEPPLDDVADATIAATTVRTGRVLLSQNTKNFHFIDGLRFVDMRQPHRRGRETLITFFGISEGSLRLPCCRGIRP